MGALRSSGYHSASLPDLLDATKLSRGSLYAAFGDKHGLFLRALDCYIDEALARREIDFDPQNDALAGLRTCLAGYVDRTSGVAGKRGSPVVATAMELAAHDPGVKPRVGRLFEVMESRMAGALSRARASATASHALGPVPCCA